MTVLLALCILAAWVAQIRLIYEIPATEKFMSPLLDAFNLLGPRGIELMRSLDVGRHQHWLLYATAALLFGLLALIAPRVGPLPAVLRPLHLEEERCLCISEPRRWFARPLWFVLFVAGLAAGLASLLYAIASARLEAVPPYSSGEGGRLDLLLQRVFTDFGVSPRITWWAPVVAWVAVLPAALLAIWAGGNVLGCSWRRAQPDDLRPNARRELWEWLVLAMICVGAGCGYMLKLERNPGAVQIGEGIVGSVGCGLTQDRVPPVSAFSNTVQPCTASLTRALASKWFGNDIMVLRQTSALTGAMGLVVLFLMLRTCFGACASLMLVAITAATHTVIGYSRLGSNNIDAVWWVCAILYFFILGEKSCAGPARLGCYAAAGWFAGASFGLYDGARIGAAAVLGMALIRCFAQADFFRSRVWGYGVLALLFVAGIAPIQLDSAQWTQHSPRESIFKSETVDSVLDQAGAQAGNGSVCLDKVIARRWMNALLGFHARGDESFDYGSVCYPLAGPLLAVLSALGFALLLVRWRSWLTLLVAGMLLGGTLFGGAIRVAPDPPDSARLLVLFPAVLLAAGAALDAWVGSAAAVTVALLKKNVVGRMLGSLFLVGFIVLGGWAVYSEGRLGVRLYQQQICNPECPSNHRMRDHARLVRFLLDHARRTDYLFQYGPLGPINVNPASVEYYAPKLLARPRSLEVGERVQADQLESNSTLTFLFAGAGNSMIDQVRADFPGGRTFPMEPGRLPDLDGVLRFDPITVYQVHYVKGRMAGSTTPPAAASAPGPVAPPSMPGASQLTAPGDLPATGTMHTRITLPGDLPTTGTIAPAP